MDSRCGGLSCCALNLCLPSPFPEASPGCPGSGDRGSRKSPARYMEILASLLSKDINPVNPLQADCLSVRGLSQPGTTDRCLNGGLFSPSLKTQVWAGGSSQGLSPCQAGALTWPPCACLCPGLLLQGHRSQRTRVHMTSCTLITSLKAPPPNSHILKTCDFYLSTWQAGDITQSKHKLSPSELNVASSPSVCPARVCVQPTRGQWTVPHPRPSVP